MSITYTSSNQILNYLFGSTSFTNPTDLWMGVSSSPIYISGSGAAEPSDSAYERIQIPNSKTYFTVASSGSLTNLDPSADTFKFPESTESWGTIKYVFFASGSIVGVEDILYYEQLATPKIVQQYTTVYFSPSSITISMLNS